MREEDPIDHPFFHGTVRIIAQPGGSYVASHSLHRRWQDTGDLIQALLEREGYIVVRAADGRQAVCLIRTMPRPALILLDMMVPYLDGFELLAGLRHKRDWCRVPIIMVSVNRHRTDIERAWAEGANAFVVKQAGLTDLVQVVNGILDHGPGDDPMHPTANQADNALKKPARPRQRSRPKQPAGGTRKRKNVA